MHAGVTSAHQCMSQSVASSTHCPVWPRLNVEITCMCHCCNLHELTIILVEYCNAGDVQCVHWVTWPFPHIAFRNTYNGRENVYTEDMSESMDLFDTGSFNKDHALYSAHIHRVLGKMKSETGSTVPLEFVGLHAKMYSLCCGKKNPKRRLMVSKNNTLKTPAMLELSKRILQFVSYHKCKILPVPFH